MVQVLQGDIETGFMFRVAFCDNRKTALFKGFEIILVYNEQLSISEL